VVALITRYGESFIDLDEYRLAFNLLDKSGQGIVRPEDLVQVYGLIGQKIELEKAKELVEKTSLFGKDSFNLQDFIVYSMRK
jgi:Ca2+-binding EF-hand superfamily protein